jgi:hypothetical protein
MNLTMSCPCGAAPMRSLVDEGEDTATWLREYRPEEWSPLAPLWPYVAKLHWLALGEGSLDYARSIRDVWANALARVTEMQDERL